MKRVTKEKWEALRTRPSAEALFAAELCHRVANEFAALSAILSIAKRGASGRSLKLLEHGEERVNSFVALHRLLIAPLKPATVDLSAQIEQVCLAVAETRLAPIAVSLTLRTDECEASARTAWILSLLTSEVLTNAAKHAYPDSGGTIVVTLGVTSQAIALRIADDGLGDAGGGSGLPGAGSTIISELAGTLGGSATRISTSRGTIVDVIVPVGNLPHSGQGRP